MQKVSILAAAVVVAACAAAPAQSPAQGTAQGPEVTLTRLECGSGFNDSRRFTDTYAYSDPKKPFTFSCYVIKHGSDYMVWDTGYLPGSVPNATNKPITELLAQMNVRPDQIKFVGISHFHADHTGQLAPFANATLLIGKGDWDGINSTPPMGGANVAGFKEWMGSTTRKVKPLTADEDVFGDGSVVIFRTPGHTPGHNAVLVRLKEKGPVVLLGDAAHFHENYESNGVPGFNHNRADTIASLERIKGIEKNLKATVIIQHDPRDIGKLPPFPQAAR